jgi:hypothetical protein
VDSKVIARQRWGREQALLGLARDSPDDEFAAGGLGALAAPPTVRIVVLPADPDLQCVPGLDPAEVVPQLATLPDRQQLPQLDQVRGTSSGYVRYPYSGDNGPWRSFAAVHWHGGVDFFLGSQGGHEWEDPAGPRRRVVYLLQAIAWTRAAFDLQRQIIERFPVAGPFRAILGVARAIGGIPSLVEEDVRDRVADGISYAGWLLNRIDPTNRLNRVALASRLEGIGYLPWRTRAEVAASAASQPVVLPRATLLFDTAKLAEDITVRLRRQARSPGGRQLPA